MSNHPALPPHYNHQPGRATWKAPAYATNAITRDDRPGNRKAITPHHPCSWRWMRYGTFDTVFAAWTGLARVWLWRDGQDTALFYREGQAPAAVEKALAKAVEEQVAIERACGRPVGETPLLMAAQERKK